MEITSVQKIQEKITKPFAAGSNLGKILIIAVILSIVLGVGTGYSLSSKSATSGKATVVVDDKPAKSAQQDNRTFRDFAEGVIKPIPASKNPSEYVEGTHILEREGGYPVTLTSSVVDLSKYEGKKVKVYGETQKALKASWLMDVGKVEE